MKIIKKKDTDSIQKSHKYKINYKIFMKYKLINSKKNISKITIEEILTAKKRKI